MVMDLNHVNESEKKSVHAFRSKDRLKELSARLLNDQEEERRRIAHEVHENLAQAMMAVQFRVEAALSKMEEAENPALRELLEPVTSILQEGIGSIRRLAGRLRPLILDDLGILVTISRLCRETSTDHPDLCIQENWKVEERDIPGALKLVIYRIMQSAMCSILRQKQAGLVEVSLERKEGLITLTIRDHVGGPGSGLDPFWGRDSWVVGYRLDRRAGHALRRLRHHRLSRGGRDDPAGAMAC